MKFFLISAAMATYLLATAALSVLHIDVLLKAHYTQQIGAQKGMQPLPAAAMEE